WNDCPQQALQACPMQDNTCSACLDTMEDKASNKSMLCHACQDACFHWHCIQRLALYAGISFQCPCCHNRDPFMMEMLTSLPKRPPSWESNQEVGPLDQRHSRCNARMCLCPGGREHYVLCSSRPWQLWLCSSCAAKGTHQQCNSLGSSTCSWECSSC
ncbi:G2E3 ligase, partial [Ptilonorhynchus violaceus]|nr:G2E3 ligase [Ptilonorhynchus violaceus]